MKRYLRILDEIFFKQSIRKALRRRREKRALRRVESRLDYKTVSWYTKNQNCLVSELCDKYGSDKGELRKDGHPYPWSSHNYSDFYSKLFSHCRNSVKKVFECGLGSNNPNLPSSMGVSGKPGASLRVWRDYFPNAMVYGADIDEKALFDEDRIKTFYIDQLDPRAIRAFWDTVNLGDFDFMVDDGLHTFEAGSTLFLHSIDKLDPNGIYIIEDVGLRDLLRYQEFFADKAYVVDYVCMFRPNIGLGDNNLVVVRKAS